MSYPFIYALRVLFMCKQNEEVFFEDISSYLGVVGVSVTAEGIINYMDSKRNIEDASGCYLPI